MKTIVRIKVSTGDKGGPGSGNWGHRGRAGKRGGSSPGGGRRGGMTSSAVYSGGDRTNKISTSRNVTLKKSGAGYEVGSGDTTIALTDANLRHLRRGWGIGGEDASGFWRGTEGNTQFVVGGEGDSKYAIIRKQTDDGVQEMKISKEDADKLLTMGGKPKPKWKPGAEIKPGDIDQKVLDDLGIDMVNLNRLPAWRDAGNAYIKNKTPASLIDLARTTNRLDDLAKSAVSKMSKSNRSALTEAWSGRSNAKVKPSGATQTSWFDNLVKAGILKKAGGGKFTLTDYGREVRNAAKGA